MLAVAFIVAAYVRRWQWAGFARDPALERPYKTLWDWLQLLVIPLVLAMLAFGLNAAQSSREQRHADARADLDRALALKQRLAERRNARDLRREEALSAYLTQMSDLMLQRRLLTSKPGSAVRAVAQALTFTVLRRLDGRRKGVVLRFLAEGDLISNPSPLLDLSGANLRRVLVQIPLSHVSLQSADLRLAQFQSEVDEVTMKNANLRGARFRKNIIRVNFHGADLTRANFSRTEVDGGSFASTFLTRARFTHAALVSVDLRYACGDDIDFSDSEISFTDMSTTSFVHPRLARMHLDKFSHGPAVSTGELNCG